MDNKSEQPSSTERQQPQQPMDEILKDQKEVISEALREMRTER